ncbi:MAG: methionyl-tRNA formyltransferase [Lachnospiraceae bacterium]|nr:methionyl-tRNA formyltransferase [Lachnospiraceae bacterium]
MKIVYMGTPDFAVGPLRTLIEAGHEVTAVVTQPDKPKGRSKELIPPPVKAYALTQGLTVLQPEKIKTAEAVEELRTYEADLFVVAAFGQILSKEILTMPKYGCVNIHASLLPKYRGAAPIQWSIIDGEKETGVTIMQMDEGLDTGDILTQKIVPISDDDTGESLFDKLCEAGSELLLETLPQIEAGTLTPVKQDESKSTYAKMLKKELGNIDFHKSAKEIWYLVRGLNSWPSAYTYYNNKTMKIWRAEPVAENSDLPVGTLVRKDKESIYVQTGEGMLRILEIQLEGKKRMSVKDFMLGHSFETGITFESEKR